MYVLPSDALPILVPPLALEYLWVEGSLVPMGKLTVPKMYCQYHVYHVLGR